mmetsp:Transcript_26344/g.47271  ORF Transcript_26344/g.47271 Transcript_26344/m.47271 type:complete len:137 (+) Transcript_26344:649-1059(+)
MDRRNSILGFLKELSEEIKAQGLSTLREEEIFNAETSTVNRDKVVEWKNRVDELTFRVCEKWFDEVIELDQELRQWATEFSDDAEFAIVLNDLQSVVTGWKLHLRSLMMRDPSVFTMPCDSLKTDDDIHMSDDSEA